MSEYANLDNLREMSERDIESGGRLYRIRKLSVFEWMDITGIIPQAADGEPARAKARGKQAEVNVAPLLICTALLIPRLASPSDLYLIPAEDQVALIKGISDLMGMTHPFAGDTKSET